MKFIVVITIAIFLLHCKKGQDKKIESLPAPQASVQLKDTELERWRDIITKEPFLINVREIPNPFTSPKLQNEIAGRGETTPLELVGIVEKNGRRLALLQDSQRRGYIVKAGDRLGDSRIREIGNNFIVVEEIIRDSEGKRTIRTRIITLRKE